MGVRICQFSQLLFLEALHFFLESKNLGQQPRFCPQILNKVQKRGFPRGTVLKNPPANAGDTGSSPGLGRSHVPRNSWARAPQLLSLHSRPREPQLLSLHSRAREPQLLSLHSRPREPQLLSPRSTTMEPARLESVLRNKRSHRNEKPAHWNEE